jgi:hypothetical protein
MLVSLDRLKTMLGFAFTEYPGMVSQLFRYCAVIDDMMVKIKSDSIKIKHLIDELASMPD